MRCVVILVYSCDCIQWADLSQSRTCEHNLLVCGFLDGEQNNWMITQYINISRTGVTELILNATFFPGTGAQCDGVCNDSARIRIFETNETDELGRSNTTNYNGNVATLKHVMDQNPVRSVELEQIPISGAYTGLYFAVVDLPPGTCVAISRLALYYYVCPEQMVDLVEYPETISPSLTSDSDVFLEANCVDNAVLTSAKSDLQCSQRGRWETNGVACSCLQGYYLFNNSFCEGK